MNQDQLVRSSFVAGKPAAPWRRFASMPLKVGIAAGVLAGVVIGSVAIVQTSKAAFSGTTENTGNNFAAGTATLTNNRTSAMLSVSDWSPGDSGFSCIEVTYDGSLTPTSAVTLYTSVTDTDGGGGGTGTALTLSDDLDVVVAVYAAGESCTTLTPTESEIYNGTLAAYPDTFATGVSSGWTPAAADGMRAFKFTVTLGTDTANDAQGDSSTAAFYWEVQA